MQFTVVLLSVVASALYLLRDRPAPAPAVKIDDPRRTVVYTPFGYEVSLSTN